MEVQKSLYRNASPVVGSFAFETIAISPLVDRHSPVHLEHEVLTPHVAPRGRFLEQQKVPTFAAELHLARNALKLAAKFSTDACENSPAWEKCTQELTRSVDIGTMLLATHASPVAVQAGFLAPSLDAGKHGQDVRQRVVQRKFRDNGEEIVELAHRAPSLFGPEQREQWLARHQHAFDELGCGDTDFDSLVCAKLTAELGTLNRLVTDAASLREHTPTRAGDLLVILCSYEERLKCSHANEDLQLAFQRERANLSAKLGFGEAWSGEVALQHREGLSVAAALFEGAMRKWGPEERLPLLWHLGEVGMLLIAAGAGDALVNAGYNHDAFENYVATERELIAELIRDRLGAPVVELIEAVTEPRTEEHIKQFWPRKLQMLQQLKESDRDAAVLSIATKVSTLSAGNKFLYVKRPITDWSRGTLDENIEFHTMLLDLYKEREVPTELLLQLEIEIERMKTHRN